jgi:hypothetical protein
VPPKRPSKSRLEGHAGDGRKIRKTTLRDRTRAGSIRKTIPRSHERIGAGAGKICKTTLRGPAAHAGAGVAARPRRTQRRHQIRKTTLADGDRARAPPRAMTSRTSGASRALAAARMEGTRVRKSRNDPMQSPPERPQQKTEE